MPQPSSELEHTVPGRLTAEDVQRGWLLARATSQLPHILWVHLDPEGRIVAWNAAAATLLDPAAGRVAAGAGAARPPATSPAAAPGLEFAALLDDALGRDAFVDALEAVTAGLEAGERARERFPLVLWAGGASVTVDCELGPMPSALGVRGLALVGGPEHRAARGALGFAVADADLERLRHTALDARGLLGLPRLDPAGRSAEVGALPLERLTTAQRSDLRADLAAGTPATVETFVAPLGGHGRSLRIDAIALRASGAAAAVTLLTVRDSSAGRGELVELQQRERRLRRVVEATASVTGRGFLRSLVRSLCYALDVRVAYVAERTAEDPERLRMLCLWSGTEFTAGYTYQAAGVLDELVLADGPIRYDQGLQSRLAADSWFNAEGLESYFGVPIRNSADAVVGVLGVLSAGPLDESLPLAEILGVFAARVGVELERLRAEEALRASEDRWRSLVQNAPDLILAVNSDGRIDFHNLSGLVGAPAVDEDLLPRVEAADRERFRAALAHVAARDEPTAIEVRARFAGVEPRWYAVRLGALHRGERDGAAIVVATDIEETKRRDALARRRSLLEQRITSLSTRLLAADPLRSEEEVQLALEELGVALEAECAFVYRFDGAERTLHCTQTWTRPAARPFPPLLGGAGPLGWLAGRAHAGRETVVGLGGPSVLLEPERDELEGLGVTRLACVPLRCSADERGLLGFASRDHDAPWDGELLALIRIAGDLIANTFERARATEHRLALERELRHAQKLEAIGTLAGGIAHDFNNLLTTILGHASLLQRAVGEDDKLAAWAGAIEESAQRAAGLTSQLQRFGRRREADFVAVDVHATLREVEALVRRTFPPTVEIVVETAAPSATIAGDAALLSQAILNLAVNARDALPGGGRLRIATRGTRVGSEDAATVPELSPGQFLAIEVVDDGVGMRPELLDRIFDPFFTTKARGEGRGMGLSTVYGIVRKHGGTVRVDSELGGGSTFTVLLPLADAGAGREGEEPTDPVWSALAARDADPARAVDAADVEAAPDAEPSARVDARADEPRGATRILVVDDEAVVLLTATAMLESLGYGVVGADSGETAVDVFARATPPIDLVLLDLMMPGMDGRECLARLLAIDPGARVVLSSGWGFEGIVQELRDAGIIGFANKPYGLDELEATVEAALIAPRPPRA